MQIWSPGEQCGLGLMFYGVSHRRSSLWLQNDPLPGRRLLLSPPLPSEAEFWIPSCSLDRAAGVSSLIRRRYQLLIDNKRRL